MQEDTRPKLTDPKEFEIIRSIYFDTYDPRTVEFDQVERYERMKQGKQRNQAR